MAKEKIEEMTIEKFIKKHKIKSSLAAGFSAYMRSKYKKEFDSEYKEDLLINEYGEFSGVEPVEGKPIQTTVVHKKDEDEQPEGEQPGDKSKKSIFDKKEKGDRP